MCYVDDWNVAPDSHIPGMTVGKVLKREDTSAEGCSTMPEFIGTKEYQGH